MAVEYTEKRKHPRYACDTGVRVLPEKGTTGYWGTVADISLGGCYIQTFSPLPPGQTVVLALKTNDEEIEIAGKTVSSHPGVGMGVSFGGFVQPDGEERFKAYILFLASQPPPKSQFATF